MSFPTEDSFLYSGHLKQQILKWRSMAILFAVVAGLAILGSFVNKMGGANVGKEYIARVSVEGFIAEDSYRDKVLKGIIEDDNAKALILHINSPGGTIVGGETLYNSIKRISDKKPVVSVLGSLAASGGYMTAVASDHIVSHNGTLTGSIGVLFQTAEISDLAKKIGINVITFKSGIHKGAPSPFEKMNPQVSAAINESLTDSYNFFVDLVDENREELTREDVVKLADGRVYTGRQAFAAKLVDAIGSEETAIEWLKSEHEITDIQVRDIAIKKQKHPLEKIMGSFVPDFFKREINSNSDNMGIIAKLDSSFVQ